LFYFIYSIFPEIQALGGLLDLSEHKPMKKLEFATCIHLAYNFSPTWDERWDWECAQSYK